MQFLRLIGRFVLACCVTIYMVIDEVLTRVLWPAIALLSRLPIFKAIGDLISRLPPYGVLVLLAVPFIIIEPAKVFALYWAASGHVAQGLALLIASYVISILTCDRIYHSGHAKLMQIDWFKTLMTWLIDLRDRAVDWIKSRPAWIAIRNAARSLRDRARLLIRSLRA
jgi:hypothetical protein